MKRGWVVVAGAVLALAGGAWWIREPGGSSVPSSEVQPGDAGSSQVSARVLRFPDGAPQLAFLRLRSVQALPEPLLDPFNGRLVYDEDHTARVASPIAGRVVSIAVRPGDGVRSGQPLVTLDSPEYGSTVADVRKSEAELRQKELAFVRARTLYEGEVLARREFEAAEADLRQAEAEHARARQRLASLNPRGAAAGDGYALRSPIAGVVVERQVNPGSEVRPDAQAPLFVVTDPSHLWAVIDLPERELGKVRVGQQVAVEVDAFPDERFPGRIASIGEVVDPQTRRIPVRCVLDNPKRRLKPEMYARITPLPDAENRLPRVPNAAIITQGLYSYVFVEQEAGTFERRVVTPGLQGRDYTYLKAGVREGERVVVTGALLLNSELVDKP